MEFRMLGPLEAGDGREALALGPRKQRALLARLLLDAGRTVSVERLVDDLWGDDLPDTAVKMVQIYVSGLRKALSAERLLTRPPGYCLELASGDELDLHRFERLTAAGRAALAQHDPTAAAQQLRAALELFRGPALAEFSAEPFARAEGDRLEELRLAVLEDRIEADLALGRAGELVGELEALAARQPLRERLREQLMLALYRCGRQGEALAAYRAFHSALDEQLGIEPSARLRALERAILVQDHALDAATPAPPVAIAAVDAPAGRAGELRALHAAFAAAAAGGRRLALVTGEPGIGKTTLVEAFLAGAGDALVISGQCVEHRGPGEPYLPLLDGLGRVAEERSEVADVLAARAPSWLDQLPWLAREPPAERARGASGERMLRELVDALEALAGARPVVLLIEDLQWADPSTLDLLGALMRRRHPARLLVLATGEAPVALVSELRLRGVATEIALGPLDIAAVAAGFGLEREPAERLAERGGGNPLFIGHLVEHLASTGSLDAVPETLQAALRTRLASLGPGELELLQAAAVDGQEFTAATVAAALGRPVGEIAAAGVVSAHGTVEWPDGTSTAAFAFVHALHRDVLLETIAPARLAELHRRIGERLEAAFGADLDAAPRIAAHHLAGRRPAPAVRFLRLAARRCFARRAYREGLGHLQRALAAAEDLPDGPLRSRAQVELLSDLGQAHVALGGWSSPDALAALEQARATAEALADKEPLAAVLVILGTLHEVRGEVLPALEAAGAGRDLGAVPVQGAELLACALFHQGAFTRALEYADRGVAEFERDGDAGGHYETFPATFGDNAGVACHDWAALSLWFLGHPGESLQRARHALELSGEPARAYSVAAARAQLAVLHVCRGEAAEAERWAEATIAAARDRGYSYRVAMGRVLRGWALAAAGRPEGLREIACGLQASRDTGAHLEDPLYLGLLADAHLRGGTTGAGLAAVEEGLAIAARERAHYYDAELLRLRGELLQAAGRPAEAEEALRAALAAAREQGARSLELRAALALARAAPGGKRAAEARALLATVHESMAGEDTPDVRAAAALLANDRRARPEAERRGITVLAWEVDGLGDLAERLDPERLPAVVADCHAAARAAAEEAGGHVATENESGGLVYFGYPRAAADAPRQAVRAARALAGAVSSTVDGVTLRACVGVHTGPAVFGAVGDAALALGQTPRTAWHLAAAAPPGEIVVSDATRALCEGHFEFAELGAGHRVTGEARAGARAGEELSPLVGRERQLGLLLGRCGQATEGLGQGVLVTGEPGIGKSRLVRELAAWLEPGTVTMLEFQSSEAGGGSALHPVADHFRRLLGERPGGVEALLAEAGLPVADSAPVIAALLGAGGATQLAPDVLKRRTADIVVSYVLGHSDRRPVVAVFEDLHWADPSTLALVAELLDAVTDARVLLVATFRPELRPPWEPRGHVGRLPLDPLTRGESEQLLRHVASVPLPDDTVRAIVERSAGVPLVIEELARDAAAGGGTVPATLRDSLVARLDRLGPDARTAAELGALIGREFPRDLLRAASELPPGQLDRGLDELVAAGLLRPQGRPPSLRYAFRHALLQEGASQSPSGHARHLRIAQALERSVPDAARTEPETLARHLEQAGEPGRAAPYRLEAGRLALTRSASAEAVEQLTRALDDLAATPDDDRRAALELSVRVPLGSALIAARGYAAQEVGDCYARARELCARTGDEAQLLPVVYGLWVNAFVRADHERALDLAVELRGLAERHDPNVLIVAERALGWPLLCMGRVEEARAALDRAAGLHDPSLDAALRLLYGQDPAVSGLAAGAWALWGCGERAAAGERAAEAVTLARTVEHPLSLVYALGTGALLAAFASDAPAARERAVEAIALNDEFGMRMWRPWAGYALGWAQLAEGAPERAAATVRAALDESRTTGAALFEPFALTVLAEAESAAGRAEEALWCAEEADALARRSGELFWEPRIRRVHEELLAARRG